MESKPKYKLTLKVTSYHYFYSNSLEELGHIADESSKQDLYFDLPSPEKEELYDIEFYSLEEI